LTELETVRVEDGSFLNSALALSQQRYHHPLHLYAFTASLFYLSIPVRDFSSSCPFSFSYLRQRQVHI